MRMFQQPKLILSVPNNLLNHDDQAITEQINTAVNTAIIIL
jgi:hypothetical protein